MLNKLIKKNHDNNKIIIIFVFIILIILIFYKLNIISNINIFILYVISQNEFKKADNYFNLCTDLKLKNLKIFIKRNNPDISIISPIFNRERYLLRFIKSIQYQNYINIEIILVDDFSIDNSVKIIEKYKKLDKRIILIRNKINKGTFISRNIGVLFAKGKYVIIPDPDDLVYKNILNICYKLAEKYKLDIIRFNQYIGNKKIKLNEMLKTFKKDPIYQPELSFNIFYGLNELQITDYYINNKFIKREVYIKAISSLNNFYFNMYIICFEDQIINYMIYKTSKSFYFLKKIGYYFIKNSISITKNEFKISKIEIKFIFIYFKFIFELSKNTKYEKDMANLLFSNINKDFNIERMLSLINIKEELYYYYNILKIYFNSKFINNDNKYLIQKLQNLVKKKMNI